MRNSLKSRICLVLLTAVALASEAKAQLINVDFNSDFFIANYGGAAVLGAAGDSWNSVVGGFSSPAVSGLALLDSAGTATTVTLTLPTLGFIDAGSTSTPPIYSGPEYDLMRDHVFASPSVPKTLILDGLAANADYRLVLYSSSNVANRTTDFTVNGVTKTAIPVAASALIDGVNYVSFATMAGASGQLSFDFVGNGAEGNLNGFQIEAIVAAPVPEPSSLTLLAAGCLVLLAYGRHTPSGRAERKQG